MEYQGCVHQEFPGEKVVDFKNCNLHVLNYSTPINGELSLDELRKHLYYLPDHPEWIPYRTSYYKEDWGFCLSYNQYEKLTDEKYDVHIDSTSHARPPDLCRMFY